MGRLKQLGHAIFGQGGHLGDDLDQSLENPLNGTPDLLSFEIDRPIYEEKISEDHHFEQPGLVGL